jgi:hypothetical protein
MYKTLTVTFDGQALWPESPLDLEMNGRYVILVEPVPADSSEEGSVWDLLETLAGTVDAPSDWSAEHDHYLYGTPKRYSETVP